MFSYNFDYYRPASIREAAGLFQRLDAQGKRPMYWSGGTEIITLGRVNLVYTEAVIDLKHIPECRALAVNDQSLIVGSALTLSELYDSRVFPLLGETGSGVADRTSRNKITLGGNICSQFIYKEAVLPLLLTDSDLVIAGPSGARRIPIGQIFNGTLRLGSGEFLVQSVTDSQYLTMPHFSIKKRKVAAIDYPVVTTAAIRTNSGIRLAFSGLCAFPFRSAALERLLNESKLPVAERVGLAASQLPAPILSDMKASAAYREIVWKNVLIDILTTLGE
ncbi:xanthine dehydrogenase [Cohnella pontilimi]|uniref:Xanthine dehydrogenase n=1 Tax=Cohnella pontilimi TaxID=2564100 RepID=A0A4U0F9J9_9BACL|nr:FAD binding domain-containing protein [Cohnella pontilimi]TJY41311.1 xanthine dehydrogenase [Cohnella pontilimi]